MRILEKILEYIVIPFLKLFLFVLDLTNFFWTLFFFFLLGYLFYDVVSKAWPEKTSIVAIASLVICLYVIYLVFLFFTQEKEEVFSIGWMFATFGALGVLGYLNFHLPTSSPTSSQRMAEEKALQLLWSQYQQAFSKRELTLLPYRTEWFQYEKDLWKRYIKFLHLVHQLIWCQLSFREQVTLEQKLPTSRQIAKLRLTTKENGEIQGKWRIFWKEKTAITLARVWRKDKIWLVIALVAYQTSEKKWYLTEVIALPSSF